MKRRTALTLLGLTLFWSPPPPAPAADGPAYTRTEDVIYGRKYGTALTMDVFRPKAGSNGLGLIYVVSGGWFSAHEAINPSFVDPFVGRGYTVFAVVHGSQPRFTIPEVLKDMNRAVRFVRHHAADYGIDPDRLGIYGGSAGGHLSLMQGTAGDKGDPKAKDPVDRESSRVQAVACFFPPTDFLNYGKAGEHALGRGVLENFRAPFDFDDPRPEVARLRPGGGRRRDPQDRPPDLPGQPRQPRRPADADRPRRRRQAGADPAGRVDRRGVEEGRGRGQAGRQAGGGTRLARPGQGPDAVRRLVRRAPETECEEGRHRLHVRHQGRPTAPEGGRRHRRLRTLRHVSGARRAAEGARRLDRRDGPPGQGRSTPDTASTWPSCPRPP